MMDLVYFPEPPTCPICDGEMEASTALYEWGSAADVVPHQEEVPVWWCPACDYTEEMDYDYD